MANIKSRLVAARDSGDNMAKQREDGTENVRVCAHTFTALMALNDTLTLCRIGVDEVITSIKLSCDDLGTTGDINIGFHRIGDNNTIGAAIVEDALGTAIDANAGALSNVEVRFETKGLDTADDKVWELAGLSAQPDYGEVFLTITADEATTATSGDLVVTVRSVK